MWGIEFRDRKSDSMIYRAISNFITLLLREEVKDLICELESRDTFFSSNCSIKSGREFELIIPL
jgi:hypothetical protein